MPRADFKSLPEAVRRRRHNLEQMNKTVLQKRYYNAHQLRLVKRINLYYEVFLAVGTSSAVGAWAILRNPVVSNFWAVFLGLITLLSVLKPILQLSGQIQRYSEAYIGYTDLSFVLKDLLAQIDLNRKVGAQIDKLFDRAQDKLRGLARLDDPRPRRRVFQRSGFEASREINDASYKPSPAQAESLEVRTETILANDKPSPAQPESPELRTE